jgi:hypothetical protein
MNRDLPGAPDTIAPSTVRHGPLRTSRAFNTSPTIYLVAVLDSIRPSSSRAVVSGASIILSFKWQRIRKSDLDGSRPVHLGGQLTSADCGGKLAV